MSGYSDLFQISSLHLPLPFPLESILDFTSPPPPCRFGHVVLRRHGLAAMHCLLYLSPLSSDKGQAPALFLASVWTAAGKGAWLAMLAMWMSTSGRVRDQPVRQYQTAASLFGICDGKTRCRLLH